MSQDMRGVTTEELMRIAMEMAGQTEFPADSKIHVGGKNLKKLLFGIDMGVAELLVGKQLGYDCVMAHHPDPSVQSFPDVLDLHVDIAVRNGVPEGEVRQVIDRMKRTQRMARHSANYDHAPSFARLLGMPYLNIHNPLDEIGRKRMQDAIDTQCGPDSTVDDVIAALNTIPELRDAPTNVELRLGKGSNRAGKTVVAHGAGTNGGSALASVYFRNGVDTVVYIHIGVAEIPKLAQEFPQGKNLVISGHIASDLAGITPFIERLEEMGIEVTRVSGL
jgi:hypothetical protein